MGQNGRSLWIVLGRRAESLSRIPFSLTFLFPNLTILVTPCYSSNHACQLAHNQTVPGSCCLLKPCSMRTTAKPVASTSMWSQSLNSVLGKIFLSYTFCATFKKTISNREKNWRGGSFPLPLPRGWRWPNRVLPWNRKRKIEVCHLSSGENITWSSLLYVEVGRHGKIWFVRVQTSLNKRR